MGKIFFDFLIFSISLVLICFLPGRAYLYSRKINLSILETFTLSLALGLVFFTLANFVFGILGIRWAASLLIGAIDLLFILFRLKNPKRVSGFFKQRWTIANKIFLLIIILGVFSQTSLLATSGLTTKNGDLSFVETTDAFWHIGLIEELTRKIPPIHPGFAPMTLTNYHYFYDLFVSSLKIVYPFSTLDLYFRFMPIFLSLLLGLSVFILTRRLFRQEAIAVLATLLTYFAGNLAFLIPLFIAGHSGSESSFFVSQTFRLIINPSFSLSLPLLFLGVFALRQNLNLISIFLLGTQIAFKVYGGIIALGALGAAALWQIVRERKQTLLLVFFVSLLLSFLLFCSNSGLAKGGEFLVFAPGWYLRAIVEDSERLNIPDWVLREETLRASGSILGVLRLRFWEFLIFLIGNLGIRVIGLIGLIGILKNLKKLSSAEIFLFTAVVISFAMPMLFIQKGSVANTIQFFYYFLAILNLYTAKIIYDFLEKKNILTKGIILSFILIFSLPTSIWTWQNYVLTPPHLTISKEEMAVINFVRKNTNQNSIILLFPSPQNRDSLYFSALTGRRTYLSDKLMIENTLKDYQERETKSLKFFTTRDFAWAKSFLKENKIAYVYHTIINEAKFNGLDQFLPVVFENKNVSIYRVP